MTSIVLGILLGLLSATVSESLGHRIFGHPSKWQLNLYARHPGIFAPFLRCYYHHGVIHHEMTYLDDVLTQFRSPEDKRKLDELLLAIFPRSFVKLVWRENYNLTLIGLEGILPFATPFITGPLLIGYFMGPLAFAASLPMAFLPVLFSKYFHPHIHAPETSKPMPWLFEQLAKTRYMKWVLKNHYLHHLHVESNFNLVLGGDFLLGVHRRATRLEEEKFEIIWRKFQAI